MQQDPLVSPVVKWAGGKRQLWPEIKKEIPQSFSTYYEPFVGGGAVLFALQPSQAVINDVNEELINVYRVIRDQLDDLLQDLKQHKNESDYFYQIREQDRNPQVYAELSNVQRASRTLYLNKTCYNGLFRVNQQGEFNAPFGRYKNPNIVNEKTLTAVSAYLNRAQITLQTGDFVQAVAGLDQTSFVYFDPPYDPISQSASFTGYDQGGFPRSEQIRLKELCDSLNKQGVKFLLSNSATEFILELYRDYDLRMVQAKRSINSNARKRGAVAEVLVKNY